MARPKKVNLRRSAALWVLLLVTSAEAGIAVWLLVTGTGPVKGGAGLLLANAVRALRKTPKK